jgi:acyl carrier protein
MAQESVRNKIEDIFREVMIDTVGIEPPTLTDNITLLDTGMDSLGFAVLVTRLEQDLGYDPFVMTNEAIYPTTFGEFVAMYDRYNS